MGSGCPICVNKTERFIYDFLKSENINIIKEYKLNDCTKRYDFLLVDFNLIIECDGRQHFEEVPYFKRLNLKENQDNDMYKMKKAILQGYSFLRFNQEDVYFNRINWKQIIKKNLFKRQTPNIFYYSKELTIYDIHKNLMK